MHLKGNVTVENTDNFKYPGSVITTAGGAKEDMLLSEAKSDFAAEIL